MIIAGIPSYNEARNIGFVVRQIDKGLRKYFPREKALIVNVDNNSADQTKEVFLKTKTITPKKYISAPVGIKGKGHNFYNLFRLIDKLSSEINIVVDADLKSIEPEWIKKMITPINRGYDFAVPTYSRNKNDALITKNFCYPLVYGLLGWDIRQPIGGEFAFSSKMVKHWLSKKWTASVYQYGIDIFMTTEAILNNFKVCQVNLGRKTHRASQKRLESMFIEIAEALFYQLTRYKIAWQNKTIKSPKIFYQGSLKNPHLARFVPKGFKWRKTDSNLWSKIVYDFLIQYETSENKKEVIKNLKESAFDRFYTYIDSVKGLNFRQAEKEVIKQAKIFHKNRNYLLNNNI